MSKPDFAPAFLRGVEHFNAREFWDAHEAWEELWLVAESDLDQFLQGLIQLAAAYHHLARGTFRGGVRLFESGLTKTAAFAAGLCGLDRSEVEAAAREHREWAVGRLAESDIEARLAHDAYPKLHVIGKIAPPDSNW